MPTHLLPNVDLANRYVETHLHPFTNLAAHRQVGPMILVRGEGVHIYDQAGKAYIEGMSGLCPTS